MQTVILAHDHHDAGHLEAVKSEMAKLGAPTLRGLKIGEHIYLLEGCHRARAAAALGLSILVELLPYPDEDVNVCELLGDDQSDFPVSYLERDVTPGRLLDVDVET